MVYLGCFHIFGTVYMHMNELYTVHFIFILFNTVLLKICLNLPECGGLAGLLYT